ncbi:MAG: ankyrin repeat protein [Edafosvirus sp.]|uniref:Ankyrin repeat protein n=1 Tax=Edafosvirus sp. TaxID=2487765 RepID=A0A3G4ZYG3_9VIRU|nr:MAG: ankyrin repeat protein [Edafosvirus sp.]
MNVEITTLIDNNKWDQIMELIDVNNIDPGNNIVNGNNLIHIACAKGQKSFINYMLNKNPILFEKSNREGNTCLHLLAIFGMNNILKKILFNNKNESLINLTNNNNESILHLVLENDDMFNWILDNISNVDINIVSNKSITPLIYFINKTKSIDDVYFNNIKKLVGNKNNNCDMKLPKNKPPMCYAVIKNKQHVIEYFIKCNTNINIMDEHQLSPLILSVLKKHDKITYLLINSGADINYSGPENNHNIMGMAIVQNNINLINFLIEHNIDLSTTNKFLDTPLHIALNNKNNIPADTLFKMVYKSNLNEQNLKGETPLHLLIKKNLWKNCCTLLKYKKVDIYKKDKDDKTCLSYVKKNDLDEFMNIVADSHIDNNNKDDPQETIYNNNFGLFNSDILHNIIYTIQILKKHQNLIVPFQYYNSNKMMNDKLEFNLLNLYKSQTGNMISDIMGIYTEYFYELVPYIIIWKSSNEYYLNKDMDMYIQKCLLSDKIKFIFFKLTLIPGPTGTHANIIIFDKENGILERFEPFGNTSYLNSDELDKMLINKLGKILEPYLANKKKKLEYLSPNDYMKNANFQIISNDSEQISKKLGDPAGYCLAWTYWYLELRLNNPSYHPKDLIKKAITHILSKSKKENMSTIFIDFIRNYASYLDALKNSFLIQAGVNKENIYNMAYRKDDQKKILNSIINNFEDIEKRI